MANFDLPCPAHLLCHLQGKMRALLTVFQSNVKSLLPVIGFTCLKAVKTIMMIYGWIILVLLRQALRTNCLYVILICVGFDNMTNTYILISI
jgi:hypothetical protein